MNTITFHDRLTWIAFRADWRARYKTVSADIRAVRREIGEHRTKRRELGSAGEDHRRAADSLQSGLWVRTREANRMMIELDLAKKLKAKQMAEPEAVAA